jgi:hypothetical protein
MATTQIYEGFSLSHAAILDGQSDDAQVNFGTFYGVRSGSIALQVQSFDNTGDDAVLSTWYWADKATVTITSGYIPFQTISVLTGSQITSSGAGNSAIYQLPLWELGSMNTSPRPMMVRVPSKDSAGNIRQLDFILYKVQFEPISFTGPDYKVGLLVNYTGTALMSSIDEKGNPVLDSQTGLPSKQIGRLVSSGVGGADTLM